jgi:hypothetical protein
MSLGHTSHSVHCDSITVSYPEQIAHNFVKFTIILPKALTATCFGHYCPVVMEHDNCTELLLDIMFCCL